MGGRRRFVFEFTFSEERRRAWELGSRGKGVKHRLACLAFVFFEFIFFEEQRRACRGAGEPGCMGESVTAGREWIRFSNSFFSRNEWSAGWHWKSATEVAAWG